MNSKAGGNLLVACNDLLSCLPAFPAKTRMRITLLFYSLFETVSFPHLSFR